MRTANIPLNNSIPQNIVVNTENEEIKLFDSIAIYEHVCEKTNRKRVLTLNLVGTSPAHLKGWELVKKRELMTIGVSLGNGYFTRDRLEVILTGMATYFREVVVIVPDLPALYSYGALGYNERQSIEKVKNHRHGVERCLRRVSEQMLINFGKQNITLLKWSDNVFAQKKYYQQAQKHAIDTYNNNPLFKESILRNTERYILARLEYQDVQQLGGIKKIVEKAAHYLIEEMAFHEVFHIVLNKSPISSYYKNLELVPNYLNGNYGNLQNNHVGWAVYNIIDKE